MPCPAPFDRRRGGRRFRQPHRPPPIAKERFMPRRFLPQPLIAEPGMSDPHALVVGDACYLFTGHDVGFGVDDWVMPDWRIFRSDDLRNWTRVGKIDPADTYLGAGHTACWAGDVVERNGRFYWYFSNGSREIGVAVATRPEGPYADALGGPLVDSFDPTVFVDVDGAAYLVYGIHDYWIAPLAPSMTAFTERPRRIELDRRGVFPSSDKNALHERDGVYYLSCSGYYATSRHLHGPYVHRGLVGTGWGLDTPYAHGDFFTWKGDAYHVWCRYRDRSHDRIRDCFIAPVVYGEDGSMRDDLRGLGGLGVRDAQGP
jgi:arabinoxylan arabinofuranohydrolase